MSKTQLLSSTDGRTAGAIDPDNRILFFGNGDISSFTYNSSGVLTEQDFLNMTVTGNGY